MNTYYSNFIKFDKIILFIALSLPVLILTGPFLSDFAVSLLSLFFIYLIIKEDAHKYLNNKLIIIFLFFNLYLIFTSLISENILLSLESSIFYVRFIFFSLAIMFLIKKFNYFLSYFSNIFIATYVFVIIDGYFQYFFGFDIFLLKKPAADRISGVFGDEMILGGYVARFFPFAIALFLYNFNLNKKINKLFFISLFILSFVIVFLSGERTSFGLLIISQIIFLILLKEIKIQNVILISFIFFISLLTLIAIDKNIKERMINYTIKHMTIVRTINDENVSCWINDSKDLGLDTSNENCYRQIIFFSRNHHAHYLTAFKMFVDKPIFGHGTKMFRHKCNNVKYFASEKRSGYNLGCSTHPHNVYLQLLAETGLLGFIFPFSIFTILSFIFIREFVRKFIYKNNQMTGFEIGLYLAFFISLFPIIPSGNIFNNYMSVIFYLPLGFFLYKYINK